MTSEPLDMSGIWDAAMSFGRFVEESTENLGLWEGVYRTTPIPEWAIEKLTGKDGIRFLVIAEDWCGDASNTVPVVAKLADAVDGVEARVIRRDENPDVMDRYLTNGARSIPIAIILDANFNELGYWGPRPSELQQWVMDNKDLMPKEERYPKVRRWYAKDKGESTIREVLEFV